MNPLFVELPNVDATKLYWINVNLICDIRPDGSGSEIWFSDSHAVGISLAPIQVIDEIRKAKDKEGR